MPEELETVLRWVAEGRLSPDEAEPIIEALSRADRARDLDDHDDPDDHDDLDEVLDARFVAGVDRIGRRIERAQARARRARERAEASAAAYGGGRQLRIRVTERGRQVVNLRIPIGFVDTALRFVPGLGGEQQERIRQAVRAGAVGPIIDVEDADGTGGVLISVE